MNQINIDIINPDSIFDNIKRVTQNDNLKDNKEDENKPIFKLHNIERWETKLSLRKKKINEKLLHQRKLEDEKYQTRKFNYEKIIKLDESFNKLISNIAEVYQDEEKIEILLSKISYVIEIKYRQGNNQHDNNIYNFTSDDLIQNNWAENLITLTKMYLKNEKVILYISRIFLFSCLLINNETENTPINDPFYTEKISFNNSGYFISSDKYIDIYNKILDIYMESDCQIIYNMTVFIGFIAKNEKSNQLTLFVAGTFKYIVNSINIHKDSFKLLSEKIWCLSKFELENHYETNPDLSLQIQKIYIEIFLNENKFELREFFNKEIDENNFLYNYLKIIENTSFCLKNEFVENFIKSGLLEYLIDNFINKDQKLLDIVIGIFINLTNADYTLGQRMINLGLVSFLIKVLTDTTLEIKLRIGAILPINNFLADPKLCNLVFFEKKILETFQFLLKEVNINHNLYQEICFGLLNLFPSCENNSLNKIIEEYDIIELLLKRMKDILSYDNITIITPIQIFCNMILKLFEISDNCLIEKIIKKLLWSGIEEILDKILNIYCNIDIENYRNEEEKKEIIYIIDMVDLIKSKIKDL